MVKLIIKGVLLYVTFFIVALFISGADVIIGKGLNYFLGGLLMCIVLISTCCSIISKEDFEKLTFYKYLEDE